MSVPWACPFCLEPLSAVGAAPRCGACGMRFPSSASGRPDFRPGVPLTLDLVYRYDPEWGHMPWDLARLDWPGPSFPGDVPAHWEAAELSLLRAIPPAAPGARSLDVGCGVERQRFAEPLRALGYEHVGIDIDGAAPDALADAHLLPLASASFDLIVTSAAFEHLKHPHVAMAEAARVARPGARFVGAVAYAEPYHVSYFHHSPLAVCELLEASGFALHHLVLSNDWNAFQAHLEMGFAGARLPRWARRAVSRLFYGGTLVPAYVKRAIGRGSQALEQDRLSFARSHSALVGFVATRREGPAPMFLRRGPSGGADPS